MGLDISFNLKEALEAGDGLETQFDVVDYRNVGDDKQRLQLILRVPGMRVDGGMKRWVQVETYNAASDGTLRAMVRANRWGHTYEPLTDWLKAHNIEWVET